MGEAFLDGALAPGFLDLDVLGLGAGGGGFEFLAVFDEAFGGVGAAVQENVLDKNEQFFVHLFVNLKHRRIYDAHVHAGLDGVVEEGGVHGLAHGVVAAETEGDVGDAAADFGVGEVFFDPARGLDEIDGVVVVLLDAGADGEDVGVENDVFGRKPDLVHKQAVGAFADADFFGVGGGLAVLVEGHDDHGGAVAENGAGLFEKFLFAFLERDRVHDALALKAFQAGLDDLPFGGVHHDGDLGDLGLGADELEETRHGGDAVDEAVVHADVDDVSAVVHLLAGDRDGLLVVAGFDELGEFRGAGDVGALADHDEGAGLLGEGEGAGEAEGKGARS